MYHVESVPLSVLLDHAQEDRKIESKNLPILEHAAVRHHINHEVPGTYRLVSVNRIEYGQDDSQGLQRIVYQFIWAVPEN